MTTRIEPCPTCGHDPRVYERRHRQKLARAGLPLPDSTSKRRGVSVVGLRGAAPRYVERDAKISSMRELGMKWREIGARFGIGARAACHAAKAHRERQR